MENMEKLELAILSGVFVTVASQILNSLLKDLRRSGSKNVAQNCKLTFLNPFCHYLRLLKRSKTTQTKFRGAVLRQGEKIQIRACVFLFSL